MAETPQLTNRQLAAVMRDIATRLEIKGESPFKTRAYRNAADVIEALDHDIRRDWEAGTLREIPGIGQAIATKLDELLRTGRLTYLEQLKQEVPEGVVMLTQVPEVGPKTAGAIYETLGIATLEALEEAARDGRLREVSGVGPKTEARILAGIEALRRRRALPPRVLLGKALPRAESLLAALRAAAGPAIAHAEIVGSLRRRRETVGNIDLLVASDRPAAVLVAFERLATLAEVLGNDQAATVSGERSVSARLHTGEQVDLRVVSSAHWGNALQYFTGSAMHNVALRALANQQGLAWGEYGLQQQGAGAAHRSHFYSTEEALYEALGLEWIPPELRENWGEIEVAREHDLPNLVTRADLRGDLHMHTLWSDGSASIAEMAAAARARGYEYIVIADHSQSLTITGGLDVDRLGQQRIEILNINSNYSDFRVLQGAEVEIKNDGSLDYPDEVLEILDVVIASLHTGLRQDRDQVTRRALAAIHNPHVDILGHPTGRLLGRREGAALDIEAVLQAAAESGTILEVNSQIDRLDLDPIHVRAALELGCLIAVDSDAHSPDGLEVIEYGVWQARRGWATPDDVINTRPLSDFLDYIHRFEDNEED